MGGLTGNYRRWGEAVVVVAPRGERRGGRFIHLIGEGQEREPREEIGLVLDW